PFFQQTGTKQKRRPLKASHAVCPRITPHTSAAWWDPDWLTPDPQQMQTQGSEVMGKKYHKSQASASQDMQDIDLLLQHTPKPREQEQTKTWACDLKEKEGVNDTAQGPPPMGLQTTHTQTNQDPVTKQDIENLFNRIQQLFAADIAAVRTEVQAVTAHAQATDSTIADLQRQIAAVKDCQAVTGAPLRNLPENGCTESKIT
ncbi:Hypothetical predicted protein, partial [Pelobates cultripes]